LQSGLNLNSKNNLGCLLGLFLFVFICFCMKKPFYIMATQLGINYIYAIYCVLMIVPLGILKTNFNKQDYKFNPVKFIISALLIILVTLTITFCNYDTFYSDICNSFVLYISPFLPSNAGKNIAFIIKQHTSDHMEAYAGSATGGGENSSANCSSSAVTNPQGAASSNTASKVESSTPHAETDNKYVSDKAGFIFPDCTRKLGWQRVGKSGYIEFVSRNGIRPENITVHDPEYQIVRGWKTDASNQPAAKNLADVLLSVRYHGRNNFSSSLVFEEPNCAKFIEQATGVSFPYPKPMQISNKLINLLRESK